jgi:hypothetical protein
MEPTGCTLTKWRSRRSQEKAWTARSPFEALVPKERAWKNWGPVGHEAKDEDADIARNRERGDPASAAGKVVPRTGGGGRPTRAWTGRRVHLPRQAVTTEWGPTQSTGASKEVEGPKQDSR